MAKSIPEVKIGNEVYQIKDRTAREHLVEVSETQPESEDNKLWIKDQEAEYEVPTLDEFNDLKSALWNAENAFNNLSGVEYEQFIPGRYPTPEVDTTADIENPQTSDILMCAKFPVKQGDKVVIKNSSTYTSYRAYAITDANYKVLRRGFTSDYNNATIDIGENASWMVVNSKIAYKNSSYVYKITDHGIVYLSRSQLKDSNIIDLKKCLAPGWYSVQASYLTNIIDLPVDYPVTSSILLKVYNDFGDGSFIRQELLNGYGMLHVRSLYSNGTVYNDWKNELDIYGYKNRGNLSDLGITDLKTANKRGWYSCSVTYLSSITDLPNGFPTTSGIMLKNYTPYGAGPFIRQELSNYDSSVWVRILRTDTTVYRDWVNTAPVQPVVQGQTINMLFVGNSFTQDEVSYLPALLKEAYPGLTFHIGMLYHGNSVLSDHVTHMTDDTSYSTYSEYSSTGDSWASSSSVKLSTVINKYAWDFVSFTQANRGMVHIVSDTPSTDDIQPYLMQLIDGYTDMIGHNVQFAMSFSHIYATNYDGTDHIPGSGNTSASFYEQVAPVMQQVLNKFPLFDMFPTGTAIQNARTTILDAYGSGTYKDMTYDGRHLQEGICCLVPAYVMAMKVLELVGKKYTGIMGSQILPTAEWITAQGIPGTHGTSQGATKENCLLAAKCAIMAIKHPFTITDCSEFNPVTNES